MFYVQKTLQRNKINLDSETTNRKVVGSTLRRPFNNFIAEKAKLHQKLHIFSRESRAIFSPFPFFPRAFLATFLGIQDEES